VAVTDRRLAYPFAIARIGGAAMEEPDYDAYVVELIKQVLLTAPGERVNRPDFGAGLRRQVFAPLTGATTALTQAYVHDALTRWLAGIINVEKIVTRAVGSALEVEVQYILIARGERRVLNQEVVF
jgi:phage baseplate assembly protein W